MPSPVSPGMSPKLCTDCKHIMRGGFNAPQCAARPKVSPVDGSMSFGYCKGSSDSVCTGEGHKGQSSSLHTPGPWRWELNLKHKSLTLNGGDPKGGFGRYDLDVLQFVRWGMRGATVRFRDANDIMREAALFAEVVPGREHHAGWFQSLSHPDARLIAAAPDLLDVLRDFIDNSQFQVAVGGNPIRVDAMLAKARAAYAKATGAQS